MRPAAATSRRFSPRVTTPALIVWQSTRHLVAESRYPGKINSNKSDVVVDGTPRYQPWGGGIVCLLPGLFLLCRAAVELRYRSRSDTQSLSPLTTTSLSRKGIRPAGVPSFLFQITEVLKLLCSPFLVLAAKRIPFYFQACCALNAYVVLRGFQPLWDCTNGFQRFSETK